MAFATKNNAWSFIILSWNAFNSAFVANVASSASKSDFFTRLEILDSSTNPFSFIF